ncbi:hypothetical protein BKA65DRAFT_565886, partial [Rhexocercosporidium sp. MPI-PUGE-AT-0058]
RDCDLERDSSFATSTPIPVNISTTPSSQSPRLSFLAITRRTHHNSLLAARTTSPPQTVNSSFSAAMPRFKPPSDHKGGRKSDASTVDLDLPPPSKSFTKKGGAGRGGRKQVKIPNPLLRTRHQKVFLPHLARILPHQDRDHHPLLHNFLALARETTWGRMLDTTTTVEDENRFMVVVQKVETGLRDMGPPRWFVPVVWKKVVPPNRKGNGERALLGKGKGDGQGKGAEGILEVSEDIKHHLANTEHNLTRSLIELEDNLDEERLLSSPRKRALTPAFARTKPWSEDPDEWNTVREKVQWEEGQLGFSEWVVDGGWGVGGNLGGEMNGNVGVLSDWLAVEGRKGRLDVKCWTCEIEWVLSIRQRGLTI